MSSSVLTSLVQVVKRVAVDFSEESSNFRSVNQFFNVSRYGLICTQILSILLSEFRIVQSSAYVVSWIPSGGRGNLDT